MRTEIHIPYRITFVPKGKKNSVSETFIRACDLNVHEVSVEEAPVAVRWTYPSDDERFEHLRSAETRWFNGRHWVADSFGDTPVSLDGMFMFDRRRLDANPFREIFQSLLSGRNNYFPDYSFDPAEVRSVEADTFESVKARAQEILDDLILINGRFWKPVREPRLCTSSQKYNKLLTDGADGSAYIHVDFSRLGTGAYRLDRLEDICGAFGMDPQTAGPKIDILIPESVSLDDDFSAALWGANRVLTHFSSDHVKWDWDKIKAFYAFRDVYVPFHEGIGYNDTFTGRNPTEQELEVICEAALSYLEFFSREESVEERFLLDRWKDRAVEFSPALFAP